MTTHYIAGSATAEWLITYAELRSDKGHSLQFIGGRWVVDNVATVASFGSAVELVA